MKWMDGGRATEPRIHAPMRDQSTNYSYMRRSFPVQLARVPFPRFTMYMRARFPALERPIAPAIRKHPSTVHQVPYVLSSLKQTRSYPLLFPHTRARIPALRAFSHLIQSEALFMPRCIVEPSTGRAVFGRDVSLYNALAQIVMDHNGLEMMKVSDTPNCGANDISPLILDSDTHLPEITLHAGLTTCAIITTEKLDVTQDIPRKDKNHMNINFSNVSADLMDTEAVNNGNSANNNGNLSVGTPREGKRKKEDSVAFSDIKIVVVFAVPLATFSMMMNENNAPRKKCWEWLRPSHSDPHLDITPPTLKPNYGQSSNSGIVQCVDIYTHIEHLDPKVQTNFRNAITSQFCQASIRYIQQGDGVSQATFQSYILYLMWDRCFTMVHVTMLMSFFNSFTHTHTHTHNNWIFGVSNTSTLAPLLIIGDLLKYAKQIFKAQNPARGEGKGEGKMLCGGQLVAAGVAVELANGVVSGLVETFAFNADRQICCVYWTKICFFKDCVRKFRRSERISAFTCGLGSTLICSLFVNGAMFLGFDIDSPLAQSSRCKLLDKLMIGQTRPKPLGCWATKPRLRSSSPPHGQMQDDDND
ncbi:uncharacterized protein F5147DRAFT_660197 [Suillus discolor]|uniref:Uncharacterized protein n=1 Tax=Suillus discolor TaxID=1912936 RepID=A0A9P7ERL1_9AGAM|nr:uncharacterized protein F5147DRAFT_660197 [Suillus discolor]KAG2083329.1 hypothetical protein F5147DRAFT_660197 [Suillus discolor]